MNGNGRYPSAVDGPVGPAEPAVNAWNTAPNEWAICSAVARSGLTAVRQCRDSGLRLELFGYYALGVGYQALCRLAEQTGVVGAQLDKPQMREVIGAAFAEFGIDSPTVAEFVEQVWDRGLRTTSAAPGALQRHVDRVREVGQLRATQTALAEALATIADWDGLPLDDGTSSGQALLGEVQSRVLQACVDAGDTAGADAAIEMSEYVDAYFDGLIEEYQQPNRRLRGLDSGFPDLNNLLSGLRPRRLHILSGESGAGKSALAKDIVARACFRNRIGPTQRPMYAHVFSLEMDREEFAERALFGGPLAGAISTKAFRDRTLTQDDWERLETSRDALRRMQIRLYDGGDLTLSRIWTELRIAAAQGRCDLAVVDYLQLVPSEPSSKSQNREQEVTAISRGLKRIARALRIPIIALSQLNEDGKTRESRAIHHDSDVWMNLERENADADTSGAGFELFRLVIKKQRGGPRGFVPLVFRPDAVRFESETDSYAE